MSQCVWEGKNENEIDMKYRGKCGKGATTPERVTCEECYARWRFLKRIGDRRWWVHIADGWTNKERQDMVDYLAYLKEHEGKEEGR